MVSIRNFCSNYGFKEVALSDKERYVKSVSNKEWFAIEILDNKIRLSYENYNFQKPLIRANSLTMDYIQYLINTGVLDRFIKKEFIRFVESVYYYILNH